MPNYNQPHQFYAGVDLHARSMFVHVLSAAGKTVFERDLPAEPNAFIDAIEPFRKISSSKPATSCRIALTTTATFETRV